MEKLPEASAESSRARSGAMLHRPDGSVDTLQFFPDAETVDVDSPWGPLPVVPAFARRTVIAVQPNRPRVCIGDQTSPAVVCYEADGGRTRIEWPDLPPPPPPTAGEIQRWRDSTIATYVPKLSPEAAERLVDLTPIHEHRSPYGDLHIDRLGNLWVERGPLASAEIEHLVFDPDGNLLAVAHLPAMRVMEIGIDYVIGVVRDELDVQVIATFALEKAPPTP